MKKILVIFAILLLATNAFADAAVYKEGETVSPTYPVLAEGTMCKDSLTMRALACDSSGNITTTPIGTSATFATASATGFAAIGAGYALGVLPATLTKVVILDNQTNGDVWVSMNAGTANFAHLKAGDVLSLNLASTGNSTSAAIHLKQGTVAPTAGTFYIYSYK